jgi:hypothetical protein
MLHHSTPQTRRHPRLVHPMEMFTGTLARTATTSTASHRALYLTRRGRGDVSAEIVSRYPIAAVAPAAGDEVAAAPRGHLRA